MARCLAAVALIMAVMLGGARSASAHAELVESSPVDGAVLDDAPAAIELRFSEPVEVVGSPPLRLIAADGTSMDFGDVVVSSDGKSLRVDVSGVLADGSYVVAWQAVSADSHPISGAYTFAVGTPSDTSDAFAAVGDSGDAAGATVTAVGRGLSFAALLGGFGVFAAAVLCAREVIGSRRWRWWMWACTSIGVLGLVVLYAGQAHVLAGSWTAWGEVGSTSSGRWWAARVVVLGLLAVVAWRGVRIVSSSEALVGVAGAMLAGCFVFAAGGHSIAGRWRAAALLSSTIHLAAAALWVGGLVVLALLVARGRVWAVAVRFSPVALSATVCLAVTGVFASARVSDSIGQLFGSPYGAWLLLKVMVVALMLFVAAMNRWGLRRGPERAGRQHGDLVEPGDEASRERRVGAAVMNLLTGVRLEASAAVLVVALTAALTGAAPPSSSVTAGEASASVSATVEGHTATVVLEPARTGGTTMHAVMSVADAPDEVADEITVSATEVARGIGPIKFEMVPTGPNHATADPAVFPVAGRWQVEVVARYGEFDQVVVTVEVDIP